MSTVRALLENGADADEPDGDGATPLVYAVRRCDTALSHEVSICLLLEHGANINAPASQGNLVSHAAELGNERLVRLLVEKGANVNPTNTSEITPLQVAVRPTKTGLAIARFLLANGANINAHLDKGTVLEYAVRWHNMDAVRLLIDRGANINESSFCCGTALLSAIETRKLRLEMARLLLAKGADVNARNEWCETALYHAIRYRREDILRLLLHKEANVNVEGHYGTALACAADSCSGAAFQLLLEAGADVNGGGGYGTLLKLAKNSSNDSTVKVELLYKYRYGRLWVVKSGITIVATLRSGSKAMLGLLLQEHAKFDARKGNYDTLLQLARASRKESEEKVKLILAYKYGRRWAMRYLSECDTGLKETLASGSATSVQ